MHTRMLELFAFFMTNSNAVFFNYHRNHTEKNVHCDLSLSRSCTIKVVHLIHIDSESSLSCTCNLFGVAFGIGIRKRAPRKGEEPVTMHHGDVVNVVDITNDVLDHTMEFIIVNVWIFFMKQQKDQ